ncbi:MAG: DsrE family protein [Flavobacteriaceae bacterium]|nr:DsrE family protein [Flavobacteriaceae bacterium]
MKKLILLLLFIFPIISFAQDKKTYFVHLSSDPMINPSAAMMSIHAANEALKQGHKVIYFAAGDGVRILIKDVINNLHTVTPHGGGFGKISQMAKKKLLEFSNNGGVIHVSEGSINTYGINQNNYSEHLIDVKNIYWSYPKELIQESSKSDIVFSY